MRFATSTFALLATISLAVATRTGPLAPRATSCNAQYIVDACRATIEAQIENCTANDWICLCQNYQNLLTCYNNCPDSAERSPVANQVTSYCNAAAPLISKSKAEAATRVVSSAAATSATVVPTGVDDAAVNTASATQAAASAFSTGAASNVVAPMGGLAAVMLGLAGLL